MYTGLMVALLAASVNLTADLSQRLGEMQETRLVIPADHPLYRSLEQAWNQGQTEVVKKILAEIEVSGLSLEEYALRYPTPRLFHGIAVNGGPIPVSDSTPIRQVELVRDPTTGTLLAFLVQDTVSGGPYHVITVRSTDGGNTWMETHDWTGTLPYAIDAFYGTVNGTTYAYLADIFGTDRARLRRFPFATGNYDGGFGNVTVLTATDTLKELAAFPNAANNFGYFLYLHSSGTVDYFFSSLSTPNFGSYPTGVTNADHGLSGAHVTGQVGPVMFAYINSTSDTLFVRWRTGTSNFGGTSFTGPIHNGMFSTSMGALADTVLVAYEYWDTTGTTSARLIRYRIMYGDTASFWSGMLSTDSTHSQREPRVIVDSGRFVVSWILYGGVEPDSIVYRSRPVGNPAWTTPWTFPFDFLSVADHDLVAMGGGVYGFLAVDNALNNRAVFMASSWTDVSEPSRPEPKPRVVLNRTVARVGGTLTLSLPFQGTVRVLLLDAMGRRQDVLYRGRALSTLQVRLPSRSGLYFLRVEGEGYTTTQRVVVVP